MKLVTVKSMKTSTPSDIYLSFRKSRPNIYMDGSIYPFTYTLGGFTSEARIKLSQTELLELATTTLEIPSNGAEVFYTHEQFKDVLHAYGYSHKDFTLGNLKTVLRDLGYLKHVFAEHIDQLVYMLKKPNGAVYENTPELEELEQLGLVVIAWTSNRQRVFLTPKGYRLTLVLRKIYTDLLDGATPGQHIVRDGRKIPYMQLWTERQGKVKLYLDNTLSEINRFLGED